jgi:hypothetical protein
VWPVEVRRYLTHKALERLLEFHGQWEGLAKWLYAGARRPDGTALPYTFTLDFVMPIVEADAAAWAESRRKL